MYAYIYAHTISGHCEISERICGLKTKRIRCSDKNKTVRISTATKIKNKTKFLHINTKKKIFINLSCLSP